MLVGGVVDGGQSLEVVWGGQGVCWLGVVGVVLAGRGAVAARRRRRRGRRAGSCRPVLVRGRG